MKSLKYVFTNDTCGNLARADHEKGKIQLGRAYDGDAGFDLHIYLQDGLNQYSLHPGKRVLVSAGIAIEIPQGYYGRIVHRSSTEYKLGLRVVEATIDAGYRGPLFVHLQNLGREYTGIPLENGMKLAQLILTKVEPFYTELVTELSPSVRDIKGFGSSSNA